MVAGEAQRLVEFAPPGGDALAGTGIDQIEREPGEIVVGMLDRGDRLGAVMRSAEKAQRRWVERLDAERQPVDAGLGKGAETRGLGGIRVGFEGDFDIGRNGPMPLHPFEQ